MEHYLSTFIQTCSNYCSLNREQDGLSFQVRMTRYCFHLSSEAGHHNLTCIQKQKLPQGLAERKSLHNLDLKEYKQILGAALSGSHWHGSSRTDDVPLSWVIVFKQEFPHSLPIVSRLALTSAAGCGDAELKALVEAQAEELH